jgi:hypothetical protein
MRRKRFRQSGSSGSGRPKFAASAWNLFHSAIIFDDAVGGGNRTAESGKVRESVSVYSSNFFRHARGLETPT